MNIVERFGTDATIDFTNASSPKLIITLKNFENTPGGSIINGQGLDDVSDITTETKDDYADKIWAALFIHNLQKQPATNTIPDNGCWISTTANRSFVTRGSVPQVAYTFGITFYKNDTLVNLNPDLVI
jgi:hypothetical protein